MEKQLLKSAFKKMLKSVIAQSSITMWRIVSEVCECDKVMAVDICRELLIDPDSDMYLPKTKRELLAARLALCTSKQIGLFDAMYGSIDDILTSQMDWAFKQVDSTIRKNHE